MSGSLDGIFRPRSIAVVGASRKRGSVGAEIFRNLLQCGFPGPVYPVNPKARVVQSVRTHSSIHDVPDDVDLAVVVVRHELVSRVVDDCIEKGVRGIIVISAGFGETGPAGKERQDALVNKVRENGVRMVGPNCLGIISNEPDCRINATFAPTTPVAGTVAFSSQSGALGVAILDHAQSLGIGIRQFVSVGNKADVSGNDLLEYWDGDPEIRVILLSLRYRPEKGWWR